MDSPRRPLPPPLPPETPEDGGAAGARSRAPAFGALLRRYRLAADLSQEALAERAGLSLRGVSDLERGARRVPQRATVRLLAGALGLRPEAAAALEGAVVRRLGPGQAAAGSPPAQGPASAGGAAPSVPQNLPVHLTGFIGREREVAAVVARLRDPGVRLLTLTGPGGVGKTRLALQVAGAVAGRFEAGVCYLPLAALREPELVLPQVAQALGVRPVARRPLLETLADALRDRARLLVLDNFEHLLPAAHHVAALLDGCPRLRVLVTSRAVLRLYGEHAVAVPPLAVPGARPPLPLERLAACAAVQLFVARARAARADFRLTAANAAAVADLCRRLDGLPLALELAAARLRHLTPQALATGLRARRLPLLTGGGANLPARQQTLRATLAWSHDLLAGPDQALFARLSVFAGGWSLEAAEAVAGAGPAPGLADDGRPGERPTAAVFEALARLVDQSLVLADGDADGQTRYRYLETVGEYAGQRLGERGQAEACRDRHLAYFVALATAAEPELQGPAQGAWLERLERDHDNCRAALRWVLDRPTAAAVEQGLRLAGALGRLWLARGLGREARSWLDALLALPGPRAPTAARAKALGLATVVAYWFGDVAAQDRWLDACATVAREAEDPRAAAVALRALGDMARRRGRPAEAAARLTRSLALFRQVDDHQEIARTLWAVGMQAHEAGDYAAARRDFEESLALYRRLGDRNRAAGLLHQLGHTLRAAGGAAASRPFHEEALAIWREQGYENGVAGALNALGEVALATGDAARAGRLFAEALARVRADVRRADEARILRNLAMVAWTTGDAAAARARLAEAIGIWQAAGAAHRIAETWEAFAVLAVAHDQPERALRLRGAAGATREAAGCPLSARRHTALDRDLAPARLAVPDAALALAQGRTMPPAAAIDEALGGAPASGGRRTPAAEPAGAPPAGLAPAGARTDPGAEGAAGGPLRVDPETYTVWRGARPLPRPLAAKEFALVRYLHERAGRVCSRQELGDAVWGRDRWDPAMLYRLVRRVKEKLEPDPGRPRHLRTVPGFGYRLAPEPEALPPA